MPLSIKRHSVLVWLIGALAFVTVSIEAHGQDLEPRAYANTPVGLNFLIGGYAYSKGGVGTDPSVPIEDAEVELHSTVLAYVRTLDLWGRSGKFDLILPYTWASGSAKLLGQTHTREFRDSEIRDCDSPCCCTARRRSRLKTFATISRMSSLEQVSRSLLRLDSTTPTSC